MSDLFFFSYSRDNYGGGYLQLFFDDLSARIRELLGLGRKEQVGYLDQPELKLGSSWRPELAQALQTCRTMVCVYSPAYFKSPNCAREWEFFRRRRNLYVEMMRGGDENVLPPPVIKPVIWVPQLEGDDPPAAVKEMQYYLGGPDEPHNEQGVAKMRKHYNSFATEYDNFVDRLAREIIAANSMYALPPLVPLPTFTDLPNPFSPPPALPPPPPPPTEPPAGAAGPAPPATALQLPGRRGPKTVYFVFIAGEPAKFPQDKRQPLYYIESGGGEWKPYYPDMEELDIFPLVQIEAGKLNFSAHELPYTDDLAEVIREAERRRSIVVLFVDCWTTELPEYSVGLNKVDESSYFNCSVFVPWNLNDEETKARVEELEEFISEKIFPRWSGYGEAVYKNVYDLTELREHLKRTLSNLQIKLTKRAVEKAEISRPIKTDIGRPFLSHKPAPESGAV